MVWKRKKIIRLGLKKKKSVFCFGKEKKISYKRFVIWEKRFIWKKKELLKFKNRFVRRFDIENLGLFLNKVTFSNKFFNNNFLINFKKILFVKKFIFFLLKILLKKGNKLKYINVLKFFLINLNKKFNDLYSFFFIIKKKMHVPLKLRLRIVAGRKVYIPVVLNESKEIFFILRIIISSLKNRNEKTFKEKIFNEFFDIYNNKGFSLKRKMQILKELHDNLPNVRFLNF